MSYWLPPLSVFIVLAVLADLVVFVGGMVFLALLAFFERLVCRALLAFLTFWLRAEGLISSLLVTGLDRTLLSVPATGRSG
jgi:hypothetical protein